MNIEQTENELIIRESLGCFWILGLLFASFGGILVFGSLAGLANYQRHEIWMLALTLIAGVIFLITGIRIIYSAPITKIVISRVENSVLISRFGLLTREDFRYDFDEIEGFCLSEDLNAEGSGIWYFALRLKHDEIVRITSLTRHSEIYEREYVVRANEFMHKQLSSAQIILQSNRETPEEMR